MVLTANAELDRLKGMSILLAEDNVTNQLVATQMLKTLGAVVDVASDGAIALERISEKTFDLLLIDIEMPRVSGLDVIRAVRADDGPLSQTPVIALTAYAMEDHRVKIREVGADGLIPKPITSIEQFGLDILGFFDVGRSRASKEEQRQKPTQIDRVVFDSLAASLGEEAMAELLVKVHEDLKTSHRQIDMAAEGGDAELMRAASHILISVSGALGAVRLQGQSEKLNRFATDGDLDAMRALAPEALKELSGLLDFVDAEAAKAT